MQIKDVSSPHPPIMSLDNSNQQRQSAYTNKLGSEEREIHYHGTYKNDSSMDEGIQLSEDDLILSLTILMAKMTLKLMNCTQKLILGCFKTKCMIHT